MSPDDDPDPGEDEDVAHLRRRLDREHRARLEAEAITEQVTAQLYETVQELERAKAELESTNQALRDFLAMAAHDLRSPLATIMGFASTMNARWDKLPDDRKRDFLEAIERQARRLARLVENLLTVSRIEAGAMEARIEDIALARMLGDLAQEFADRVVDLSVSCPVDLTVAADPDHLHRILENYLANAVKYGEPPVDVQVTEAGDWVEVRVCDHGEGVPEDFVPHLFDKFARAGLAVTGGAPGTGLGLSIVFGLAQLYGGTAWYEPNLPSGSCFAVRLPRRTIPPTDES